MKRILVIVAFAVLFVSIESTTQAQGKPENAGEKGQQVRIQKEADRLQVTTSSDTTEEATTQFRGNSKIKFDAPVGIPRLQIQGETDTETIILSEDSEVEIEDEDSTESGKTKVNRRGGDFVVENAGVRTRSNFPLSVNPETNELTITTPSGEKTVVLPSVAIQNMISKAGFNIVEPSDNSEASDSGEIDDDATDSAELDSIEESDLTLILDENGQLVYEAEGVDTQRLLGLLPVGIRKKVQVSAETGEVTSIQTPFWQRILDVLSF